MNIIDKIAKKFNDKDTVRFSEKNIYSEKDTWVHTGSPELDYNAGLLGFPVGLIEISGKSKSGKTTLALHGMKNFQKKHPEGICIILSSENRDNKEYAEQIGVDTTNVLIIKSKFVEDLFFKLQIKIDQIVEVWREEKLAGKPKIFVYWDSLGATLSRAEADVFKTNVDIAKKNDDKGTHTEYKHAQMGSFAKNAKAAMKAMLAQIYEKDIVFLILNHLIDNFQTGGQDSPGGGWVEFLPSLRLRLSRKEWVKVDEEEVAQISIIKIEKNDFGSRAKTELEILLGKGIVINEADIAFAVEKGILKKEGERKFTFLNKLTWNSKRTYYQNYWDNHPLLPVLHKKIVDARHEAVLSEKGLE